MCRPHLRRWLIVAPVSVYVLPFFYSFFFQDRTRSVDDFSIINAKDVLSLRDDIRQLAHCSHQKIGSVHGKLRSMFNYNSYKTINYHTYEQIRDYLKTELSKSCSETKEKQP